MLLGPFVDAEHPAVSSGALDITFEELFATQVRHRTQLDHMPRRLRSLSSSPAAAAGTPYRVSSPSAAYARH